MAKFKYTAIDANGKQKTGTVDAATQDEASSKLSASGLMPTKITEAGGGAYYESCS
jgi:type II secretory pathway component PulF